MNESSAGERFRFGVLGTGNIAKQFTQGVAESQGSAVVAVASRDAARASAFAEANGVAVSYGSYEELLADPAVEGVYVSVPNAGHREWTEKALRAGKHVLCEKPMAVDAAEAEAMFAVAEETGCRLMEAFMYRCHPLMEAVAERVRSGLIGELRMIRSSFCYSTTPDTGNIRFVKELAGGSLMDIGCYCVNFSRFMAGVGLGLDGSAEPAVVHGVGKVHAGTGVDEYASGVMRFGEGEREITAQFACGMTVQADNAAMLCGTTGYLVVPVPWKPPESGGEYVFKGQTPPKMDGGGTPPEPGVYTVEAPSPLFGHEADVFAAAVRSGGPMPVTAADTVGNMRVLEDLRGQVLGGG
ncbi:MAG: Gfo/Idh/MocA family oxidoreductase [Planctomycetota bacterium]